MSDFDLWLEFEVGDPIDQPANSPVENFANVVITLSDGKRYCLNVWTFDFVPLARYSWPRRNMYSADLLVEKLDRVTIQGVVSDMLAAGELKPEWLCTETRRHPTCTRACEAGPPPPDAGPRASPGPCPLRPTQELQQVRDRVAFGPSEVDVRDLAGRSRM